MKSIFLLQLHEPSIVGTDWRQENLTSATFHYFHKPSDPQVVSSNELAFHPITWTEIGVVVWRRRAVTIKSHLMM